MVSPGRAFLRIRGTSPARGLKSIEAELALDGLVLDDVGYVLAAPAGVGATQGSFVYAYRFAGVSADRYPIIAVDHPEAGAWTERTIGGQPVLVGVEAMLEQGDYVRGRPYIYNSGDTRFVVVTDDEAWAVDALSQLP